MRYNQSEKVGETRHPPALLPPPSLPLLRFNLLGVSVTAANSWERAGTTASRKILGAFSEGLHGRVPVAEVTLSGVHAFPDGE